MVTIERDGSLTFRIYLPHAQSVQLVADFTGWSTAAVPLANHEHHGDPGWWFVRARVPAGDHAFSYLVDNNWWLPDYAAHGVKRNEYGNWTSLLFVEREKPSLKLAEYAKPDAAPARRHDREIEPARLSASYIEPRPRAAHTDQPHRVIRMADALKAISDFDALAEHPIAG